VDVTAQGSDSGHVEPMRAPIERRYGASPESMLVDGGFLSLADIDVVERGGCRVYASTSTARAPGHAGDRAVYRLRAATAECVNVIARNRGLQQFRVQA
jgi:hypothetical protein